MNQKHDMLYHGNININLMEKRCNLDQWWSNDKC